MRFWLQESKKEWFLDDAVKVVRIEVKKRFTG